MSAIGHTLSGYTPLDLLLVLIAVVVLPVFSAIAGRNLARTPRSELNLVRRYWFIIARNLLLSLLILLDWHWAGRPWPALGFDMPIGFRGRIGFGIDVVLVAYYAFALLVRKFPVERIAAARRQLDGLRIVPQTPGEMRLFPLVAIVGGPFEELLFRGFLIWFFAPLASVWGAVAISSLIFGLGHAYQGGLGILRTGAIGVALAVGYVLTQSLWWLMLAHIAINLFGGLFAARLARLAQAS